MLKPPPPLLDPPDSIAYTTATRMTTRQGIPWPRLDETKEDMKLHGFGTLGEEG
jgi:hypothetical protein